MEYITENKVIPVTGFSMKCMINFGNFLFRYRNTVFFIVGIVLAVSTKPRFIYESSFYDNCTDIAGFTVALSGQVLRALVIGKDYIKRGGKDKKITANRLVQGGVFAHSRNPLYLGNILIIVGLGIIYNSMWGYILGYSFFVFGYLAIVVAEENFLKSKFGAEYEDYCKRVPRCIPRFAGIRKTLGSGKFNWSRFLRKEYNMICIWVSSAIIVRTWAETRHFGYAVSKRDVLALSLCLIPIFIFYGIIRYLKKTGKLST